MAFTASTSRVVAGRPDLVKRRPVSHRPEHASGRELVSPVDHCRPKCQLGATQVREVAHDLLVGVEASALHRHSRCTDDQGPRRPLERPSRIGPAPTCVPSPRRDAVKRTGPCASARSCRLHRRLSGGRRTPWDEQAQAWSSDAEVAEIAFTAFGSKAKTKQVTARLIVRRVPEVNPVNQNPLFTVYRHHAVFTNSPLPMLEAEKAHCAHAIVEQVIADLKGDPWRTCRQGSSGPTAPGWSTPRWPSTSPAPPAPLPPPSTPRPPPARSALSSSTSPAGSPAPPASSPCTY